MDLKRSGSNPSQKAPAEHFTGTVRVDPLFQSNAPGRAGGAYVTFEPCARSDWHTHPLGQTLIVTFGCGLHQRWGGPIEEIRPGDVVAVGPNEKHWHGAAPTTAMTHIAIQESFEGKNVEWLEKVTDEQYGARPCAQEGTPARAARPSMYAARDANSKGGETAMSNEKPQSAVRKSLGEFAPRLVDLTEDVLFGDVWERPQLSKRDRSLITCAALVATGKTEQMDFHVPNAIKNGVTQEEIVEMITHLAFYGGWPNAMSAMNRAKALLEKKAAT